MKLEQTNFQKKKVAEERKKMTEKIKEAEEKEEKGEAGIRSFSVCLPLEVALPKPDPHRLSGPDAGAALEKRAHSGSF